MEKPRVQDEMITGVSRGSSPKKEVDEIFRLNCRICLQDTISNSVSLLDLYWTQKFEYCSDLTIDINDCASKIVCDNCSNMLAKFADFKEQCIKSDIYWKNLVSKDFDFETNELTNDSHEIAKTELELEDTLDENVDKSNSSFIERNNEPKINETIPKIKLICDMATDGDDISFDIPLKKLSSRYLKNIIKSNKNKNRVKKISSRRKLKKNWKQFEGHCDNCKEKFFSQNELLTHLTSCELNGTKMKLVSSMKLPKSDVFYCGLCNMSSKDRGVVDSHLKEHQSNNDLNCKLCDYCAVDFADILSHRFSHQPKEFKLIIYCHVCDKVYRIVRKLEFHYRGEHLRKKPGLCNVCGNTFTGYKHWNKHVSAHAGTTHRCEYCGRYFLYKSDLENHRNYHTQVEKTFICHLCGFTCRLASGLRSHIARHHGDNTPVKCEHCSKTFKNEITLREHKKKFEGEKNYVCHVCSKKFKTEKYLESHLFWHSGLKPYICTTCGNAYKSKCSLKGHLRSHTGERPFKCDVCLSCFWSSSVLNRHKRMHSGEKAYKCVQCDKGFNVKKMLLKHVECHEKTADVESL